MMSKRGIVQYKTNAPLGALLLDDQHGSEEWADEIDMWTLDMGHTQTCVVTQLYNDYSNGVRLLFPDSGDPYGTAVDYGFDLPHEPDGGATMSDLQAEWTELLLDRQKRLRAARDDNEQENHDGTS